MKLNIQCIGCSIGDATENDINEMYSKLEARYSWIEGANIFIKSEKHDKDQNILVEIRMIIPGYDLFCDARDENMGLAISKAFDKMTRQLEDKKNKDFSHPKQTPFQDQ